MLSTKITLKEHQANPTKDSTHMETKKLHLGEEKQQNKMEEKARNALILL